MKVILVNGSPRREGCTYPALNEVARTLGEAGIETEFFWIGAKPVGGCVACNGCAKLKKCVFDDAVNRFVELAEGADGFVIGSPVYYAGINGSLKGFLDRAFYSAGNRDVNPFRLKPAAAVVSPAGRARRWRWTRSRNTSPCGTTPTRTTSSSRTRRSGRRRR